jgi:hypothetical protein
VAVRAVVPKDRLGFGVGGGIHRWWLKGGWGRGWQGIGGEAGWLGGSGIASATGGEQDQRGRSRRRKTIGQMSTNAEEDRRAEEHQPGWVRALDPSQIKTYNHL